MYKNLKGKKLLILGATPGEMSLVKRAQKFGCYVIVTDNHKDYLLSPSKYIADEAWDISWSDIDALEEKCIEKKVDGVTAGYSEFRIENAIKLCGRLHLPCYCNMRQLEITRDKVKFKNVCRECGVPVVKEYSSIDEVDNYPVIVKPVDRAGSIGISIAKNRYELEKAYWYAMKLSVTKEVIIEEYIYKAVKFDAYYEIINGNIRLISSDDVINAKENGFDKVVQSGWILPSIHHKAFIVKVDSNMRRMIEYMGIHDGYIFFSGFADKNSDFVFFECGFRLCGGHLYNYFPRIGHCNNLDIFILHALTGSTEQILIPNYCEDNLKNVTINLYVKSGKIAQIKGLDKISQMQDCALAIQQAYIGQECEEDKAILSKVAMVYFCSVSEDELIEDVRKLYEQFEVLDEEGNDLLYNRVEPEYLKKWWNGEIINGL